MSVAAQSQILKTALIGSRLSRAFSSVRDHFIFHSYAERGKKPKPALKTYLKSSQLRNNINALRACVYIGGHFRSTPYENGGLPSIFVFCPFSRKKKKST